MECRFIDIDSVRSSSAGLAVVIDVLRAFTTAPWVHQRGADAVWLAATSEEALELKDQLGPGALAMKDGQPRSGFELGNSPDLISRMNLHGHQVIQQTTNGTVGVIAARHVPVVLAASFVNATITAEFIQAHDPEHVDFVITGDKGVAEEDLAAAELITDMVKGTVDTSEHEARIASSAAAKRLREMLANNHPGVGPMDISMAAETDRLPFVMRARQRDLGTYLEFSESPDGPQSTEGV